MADPEVPYVIQQQNQEPEPPAAAMVEQQNQEPEPPAAAVHVGPLNPDWPIMVAPEVEQQQNQEPEPAVAAAAHNAPAGLNLDWAVMVAGACFQSAITMAIQSLLQSNGHGHEIPVTFHMMCLAMLVAVAALCVSIYISTNSPDEARALEHVGFLSGLVSFLLAVTIFFPPELKLASGIIVAVSLVVILVYR